jgi:glycosyltransferase involved in cell wall biosynthesis
MIARRIVFAMHGFPPECVGGTERVVEALAKELIAKGHEVHVISGSLELGSPRSPERTEHEGIPVTRIHRNDLYFDDWDKGWHPVVSQVSRSELERLRPDLVHVHHWIRLSRDLARTARDLGIPAVVTLHDFAASCPRTFRLTPQEVFCERPLPEAPCATCAPRRPFQGDREIDAALALYRRDFADELRAASLLLAPSRAHGEAVQRFLAAGELAVEPLAVPVLHVLARATGRAPRDPARLRVAHWGTLYGLKGVHVLLRAVRRSRHAGRITVEVLGNVPQPAYARALAEEAQGLAVSLPGPFTQGQLAALEADVAVIPTLCHESYGLVLDEAFMLGLPVIASDIGAFRERGGGGVHFVPPGDEAALAAALDLAFEQPDFLAGLARRIPRSWTLPAEAADRLLALYDEVLSGRRKPLPPVDPVTLRQRLEFEWQRSELRFGSLLRSAGSLPPAEDSLPE